jgi:CTP:phosphocholine cytidylyltransferase-like protein
MLLRALENFRKVGVTEFIIIRGYKSSVFDEWKDKFGEVLTVVYKIVTN